MENPVRLGLFGRRPGEPWEAEGAGLTTFIVNQAGATVVVIGAATQVGIPISLLSAVLAASLLIGGALSIWLSVRYRQPYALGFNLTGMLVWMAHFDRYPAEVLSAALLIAGAVMLLLGCTPLAASLQSRVPVPIMLGVFTGMLFPLVVSGIQGLIMAPVFGLVLVLVMFLVRRTVTLKRWVPPTVVCTLVAFLWAYATGHQGLEFFGPSDALTWVFPLFDWGPVGELTLSLVLTAILLQNSQGLAVMKLQGHQTDPNLMLRASGTGSLISGLMLGITPTVSVPLASIVTSPAAGRPERRWVAGLVVGLAWILIVPFVSLSIRLLTAFPPGILPLLGSLALVDPMADSLQAAFGGRHRVGAFAAFGVTLSGVTVLGLSAPLVAMAAGVSISWLAQEFTDRGTKAAA